VWFVGECYRNGPTSQPPEKIDVEYWGPNRTGSESVWESSGSWAQFFGPWNEIVASLNHDYDVPEGVSEHFQKKLPENHLSHLRFDFVEDRVRSGEGTLFCQLSHVDSPVLVSSYARGKLGNHRLRPPFSPFLPIQHFFAPGVFALQLAVGLPPLPHDDLAFVDGIFYDVVSNRVWLTAKDGEGRCERWQISVGSTDSLLVSCCARLAETKVRTGIPELDEHVTRIAAWRGTNLASLSAEVRVRLDAEKLFSGDLPQ
jgi:hypothetical protein